MREPRPITRVEISEKNKRLRLIAAIALLVIGAIGITVGITSLLNQETGWQRVQMTTQERSCVENFVLQYNFAGSGAQATAVKQKLQTTYGQATVKAYQLFTPDEAFDGVKNVHYINRHPNEEIVVDPVLYDAFAKLADTRYLYMGPVYAHYSQLIYNASEEYAPTLDPALSADAAAFVLSTAHYAANPEMINLELLGDNKIILHVSQEYLSYTEHEEIGENFIDFAYMTNAFVIDFLADALTEQGLTEACLTSNDGFTRNLYGAEPFNFNIFDLEGRNLYLAGTMQYQGPISIAYLKNYPTAPSDSNYRAIDDHFVHLLVDPADGMYRTATENLVSYSYDTGCVDVMLKMLPGFVGSEFSLPQGVFSVWCEENRVCCNDPLVSLTNMLNNEEITYEAVLKN